jgi:hypothetical protein
LYEWPPRNSSCLHANKILPAFCAGLVVENEIFRTAAQVDIINKFKHVFNCMLAQLPHFEMLVATQPPASYRYRQPRTARTITTLRAISLTFGLDETYRFRPKATDQAPRDFLFRRCNCECENCVAIERRSRAILCLLNAPIGLVCGWLFWTYGIEAAIIAHFCADIVYHVCGAAVLRRKLAQ